MMYRVKDDDVHLAHTVLCVVCCVLPPHLVSFTHSIQFTLSVLYAYLLLPLSSSSSYP